MGALFKKLNLLHLDTLDSNWVQSIFHSEFLEFQELPPEYNNVLEAIEIRSTFQKIIAAFKNWLSEDTDELGDKSWAFLSRTIQFRKLMALIAYIIDTGGKNILSKEFRNNAIIASRLYYTLLAVPGFRAYDIYHSQLFAQSLTCLGFPKAICETGSNYMNATQLTYEVNLLIKELQLFVKDLHKVIEPLHLYPSDMNFEIILSNLVDVTGCKIVDKLHVDKIELANVTKVIYEIINTLMYDRNNEVNKSAVHVLFKSILPKLISASMDSKNANNNVRSSYVLFCGVLLSRYGKAALNSYIILLQYLCYNSEGMEKAEVRTARVALVSGLMTLLPRKSYQIFVKWIIQLSLTSEVAHRHIALELLAKLLSNETEDVESEGPPHPNIEAQDGVENEENRPREGTSSVCSDINDDSGQDSQNTLFLDDDGDLSGLLNQRAHTVSYASILRAVYDRIEDSSGTLRTRAMAILTECLQSDKPAMKAALKELDAADGEGIGRLVACGARAAVDPRATVRKAAIALLKAAVATNYTEEHLQLLVGLCRDACIIVRSSAIAALGHLMQISPTPPAVAAFLRRAMHQLSDPEVKIQEQVAGIIQQTVFDRLHMYSPDKSDDPLPWLFLEEIVKNNQRRQLQNACGILVKSSNCINIRTVDILSSHLCSSSEDHDLQTLTALTSIAPHVDYGDVDFIIQYYYKIRSSQVFEVRLMLLTLELISLWSKYIGNFERSKLRSHLIEHVTSPGDESCRISVATLAANLDLHNIQWATDLMRIVERRALLTADVDAWLLAADLSLVCVVEPDKALIEKFENALDNPSEDWTEANWGSCVVGAGRLGLRWIDAARILAPALARVLSAQPRPPLAAQCNALLALADLCSRHTCVVEPLLGWMCACLARDAPAQLRSVAVRALTRLLLAGFLRLRSDLYYNYCGLLADSNLDVREPAEYYVTCCLPVSAIYHHFVDCVLHFNNDNTMELSFDDRQLIYDVMLQRMSLVQKLNVQCRLARDVLQHAADVIDDAPEHEELPPALNAALLDTIALLCGPRMKLPKKPQRDGEADIDDLQERVTTNIVSHKMKVTVAEMVVPCVLRLYSRLRNRGGQVPAYLVKIANELLVDYRAEIEELIEDDEELIGRVRQFQQTIGQVPSFGNSRNLVTSSAPPEPDTPQHAPRRRLVRQTYSSPRKRTLKM